MSNFKKFLSFMMAVVIVIMSVVSSTAIIAPEDSASAQVQWMYKIDDVLLEKMSVASETDLIPVWVWMTDIDMEQLDKDIEAKTGISQQKLDTARAEIGYDVSTISANVENLNSTDTNVQNTVSTYLEATKVQREKIANDTEIYLSAKKALASQRYATANTTKIRQLGVSNDRIDFQSELTPSFIAFMTKNEIIETAQSADVVEVGYFSEYDEEPVTESSQVQAVAEDEQTTETEASTTLPTLDVSTLHTGIKQAIQHDDALEKYGVTGNDVTVLYIDNDYVHKNLQEYDKVPDSNKIINYVDGTEFSPIKDIIVPYNGTMNSHANFCMSYLQTFAKDIKIYVVAKNSRFDGRNEATLDETGNNNDERINSYDDIETLITTKEIDIINASNNDGYNAYTSSFSAQWFDAIVATYNIPLIASAGNNVNKHPYPVAPASGYNSIAVGAYEYNTNNMRDDYTYNPLDENKTRVWYKPDLVVAMDWMINPDGDLVFGATSAGAPTVTAIVAMMMELDPSLKGQPEIIKAILMASCHEKASPGETNDVLDPQELMTDGLTLKQGAGKVNALRALDIVEYGTYGSGNINQTQTFKTAKRFSINSQVFSDATSGPPMNVSIAWLRSNSKTTNIESNVDSFVLGAYCDLDLKIQYTKDGVSTENSSTADNAGKQLVYLPTTELDTQYSLKIYWGDNSTNNITKKYGYAYSIGSFEKVLDKVEVTGDTVVGETLTANAYTTDTLPVQNGTVTYRWQKSDDGESWQAISGATSSTYVITDTVFNKYIRCMVTQNYLNNYKVIKVLNTKVVIRGDVDGDGVVSVMDATDIQRYLDNIITLTDSQLIAADFDGDGVVSVIDASKIRQYLANAT